MADRLTEYDLRHPNGRTSVRVRGAARRDTLLARGYTLVEQEPKPKRTPRKSASSDEE